jgi:hypothetical protein
VRTTADVRTQLYTALSAVDDLTVLMHAGQETSIFPAVAVAAPVLGWTAYDVSAPDSATFQVYLIMASDDYVFEKLDDYINEVVAALWSVDEAAVTRAIPATYPMGGVEMPAYSLTCEVSL